MRIASISIDLDEVDCYAAIHGLDKPKGRGSPIYTRCLPRFGRFLKEEGISATFFAVGHDLIRPENANALKTLARDGHEIGNHSYAHRYDLSLLTEEAIIQDIDRGARLIEKACGDRPVGFRAPGYTVSEALLHAVDKTGHLYDSSVFPSPSYFAAKRAAQRFIRAKGRTTRSLPGDIHMLRAPADPYRIGTPYWRKGAGLIELPVGVTRSRTGRFPYIGTNLLLGGSASANLWTRAIIGRPLVNLELHGIDLSSAQDDGLSFLNRHQPGLRRPYRTKLATLRTAVRTLRQAGYRFMPLRDAAAILVP